MIKQLFKSGQKRVLLDVSTQRDLMLAEGKACVGNHRRVLANIRRMVAWARSKNVPVISTCEVYRGDNGGYCLDGTAGQKKIHYTLLNSRVSFSADATNPLPFDLLRHYQQVILNNRTVDPFEEPRTERLLSELKVSEFVVIGASVEGAVSAMVLGLLQRGKKVTVVIDAVGGRDKREAKLAMEKMKAKGARLIDTKRVAGSSHLRQVGICHCDMCQPQAGKCPLN